MAQNVGNYILCHFYFAKQYVACMKNSTCQVSKNLEFMLDKGISYLYNDLACKKVSTFKITTGGEK